MSRSEGEVVNRSAIVFVRARAGALRDDHLGLGEVETRQGQAQDLAARRVFMGEQVEGALRAGFDRDDGVGKMLTWVQRPLASIT